MKINFLIQILGSLSYALTQWLIVFFLTRYYSPALAGIYLQYLAIFTPLCIFCAYGLRNSIATDREADFGYSDYRFLSRLGIAFYIIFSIAYSIYNQHYFIILLFTIFLKLQELMVEPLNGFHIKSGKSFYYGYSKIIKMIVGLFIFLILYFLYKPIAFFGYILGIYLVYIFLDRSNAQEFLINKFQPVRVWSLIKFNTPLVISSLIVALNSSVPRFFFNKNELVNLAVFGILISFASLACLPITSITPILFSKNREFFEKNIKRMHLLIGFYCLLYFTIFTLTISWILEKIYNISYKLDLTNIALAGLIGSIQILIVWVNFFLLRDRNFKHILFVSTFTLIFLTIICYLSSLFFEKITAILISVFLSYLINLFLNIAFKKRNL